MSRYAKNEYYGAIDRASKLTKDISKVEHREKMLLGLKTGELSFTESGMQRWACICKVLAGF
jgi:hypothetical protein